ncbi:NAD(P)H-dependent oxidoreductase [Nocardia macrotermitis]|uniref:Glutathione-regulated potassium-efflux system ancillary protein KefF n=1 Tax=Nocardia macrotermitis TaxID=2585198 RepID=A0A7K0DCI6_9NOCA|nr:NAD(P)H-dependent oxidoreductase [Nocardia macrotermitis]MQY23032.1 Glutathione-regulated potassium-efflux system ancillary protein KefF [Nocardia macrotermitis]
MKVFIVHAHPERDSLNGSLTDIARSTLTAAGHEVRVSDLYAMNWKPTVDADDFGSAATHPLHTERNSRAAYRTGTLAADIRAEQDKLRWAEVVILQFPLWWYSMPAIMKGWVDRVFTAGFGYGVGEHDEHRYGDRYGEGTLAGRRALVSVTIGGKESHYSDRGINGPIEDLLFPIQHGILYFTGMEVLPPFTLYGMNHVSPEDFSDAAKAWEQRLLALADTDPIPYRTQNGGDYEMPSLRLRAGREVMGDKGFGLHRDIIR